MSAQLPELKLALLTRAELRLLVQDALLEVMDAKDTGPALLDRRGIAAKLDVGVDTVDKLRKQGMPSVVVGDAPRFDLVEVLVWLKSRGGA